MKRKRNNPIQDILDKIVQHSLALIVTFVFSTGLIGGSSYLLFKADAELLQLNQIYSELELSTSEIELDTQLVSFASTGWFSSTTQTEEMLSLLDSLDSQKDQETLDPVFASNSLDWCHKAALQLMNERGQIRGFVLSAEVPKSFQAELLKFYDSNLQIVDALKEMIVNWEIETPEDREKELRSTKLATFEIFQSTNAMLVKLSQMDSELAQEARENERRFKTGINLIEVNTTKRILSMIGIGTGVTILIVILALFRYSRSKPTLSKAHKRKPRKGKEVRFQKGRKR